VTTATARTWTHPKRHEAHAGNVFPTAVAIEKVLASRGLKLLSYEAVLGQRQTWVVETDKGRRWVTQRDGHWQTHREKPCAHGGRT
jgi:hypothetical protein